MARNNQSEKGIVETIQEVCQVRQINQLNCRGCKYQGEPCNHAINYLKNRVTRPTEIMLNKEVKKS